MPKVLPVLLMLLAASPAQAQLWDRFQKMLNPEVEVQLTHPPELGIRIQRLAFAPVGTPVEDDLVQAIIADLSSTGGVEILDRNDVGRILREQKFSNSGLVDEAGAVALGRLLGSSTLVLVKVGHFGFTPSRRQSPGERKEKVEGKEVTRKVTIHVARKQSDFVASIQAVDLTTGRLYSAKRIVASPALENTQDNQPPDFPSDAELRELSLGQAVAQVRRMILPWSETRKLIFYDDSDYGMKAAYGRLKAKDADGALAISLEALAKAKADDPVRPTALGRTQYNVGMCQFILGDCERALPYLQAAQAIDPGSGIYLDALAECTRGAQLQGELRAATRKGEGPAAEAPKAADPAPEGKPSLEDRLQKLDGLFKKGLITEEDYRKRKDEILKEI